MDDDSAKVTGSCLPFQWPKIFTTSPMAVIRETKKAITNKDQKQEKSSDVLDQKPAEKTDFLVEISGGPSNSIESNGRISVGAVAPQNAKVGSEILQEIAVNSLVAPESSSDTLPGASGSEATDIVVKNKFKQKFVGSLHSQVTCLNKEEVDRLGKEKMMTIVRGMRAAQRLHADDVPIQVEKGLFLGSVGAANNKSELQKNKITHILTVANGLSPQWSGSFKYKLVEVMDSPDVDLLSRFSQCFDFINESQRRKGGVLVHCFAGRSRSVTVVVAYLMKTHGLTLNEALEKVRLVRPEACPNFGFMYQLRDYEADLIKNGTIKRVES